MAWVKNKVSLDEPTDFEAGTERAEFITQLEEALERKKCRTNQKKIGDSLIMSSFQVQLETATQWYRWIVELESNLKMIIGSKGIALSYIIRENDAEITECGYHDFFGLIVEMSKSLWRAEEFSDDCVFVGIGCDATPSEDCVRCNYHFFFFSFFCFFNG